jgi:hypothetical protein
MFIALCSFTCSNSNAMDKILKNINALVSGHKINRTEIEIALEVKLTEDKEASARQGMHIYELGAGGLLSAYSKIELRIFNGNTKFFLIAYPDKALPLNLTALKQQFTYKNFSAADIGRKESAGYHFEKSGNKLSFYCDSTLKQINMITIEGNIK